MKKTIAGHLICLVIVCSVLFAAPPRDIFPDAQVKNYKGPEQNAAVVQVGTDDGQILYWDDVNQVYSPIPVDDVNWTSPTLYVNSLDVNEFQVNDINIAGAITSVDYIDFNTAYADGCVEGRLQWNIDDGTLEVGMPGGTVCGQILQEMLLRSRNNSGSQIDNGLVVKITGATGNRPTIDVPDLQSDTDTFAAIALATEDISNNSNGYITLSGIVRGFDTSAFSEGDQAFLDDNGMLRTTPPDKGDRTVFVGIVLTSHATEGEIWTNIIHLPMLYELSDVNIVSIADNEILAYDSATTTWKNTSSPSLTDLTLSSLTANRLLYGDGTKTVSSVLDLTSWVAGTTNQVNVANDGDGTITLSTPQDIHTSATPQFAQVGLGTTPAGGYGITGLTPNQAFHFTSTGASMLSRWKPANAAWHEWEVGAGMDVVSNFGFKDITDSLIYFVMGNGEVTVNEDSNDIDFRVESDADTDAFLVRGSDGLVSVGNNLQVGNSVTIDTDIVMDVNDPILLTNYATVWDDLRVSTNIVRMLGFSDPNWVQFADDGAGSVGVYSLAFSDTTDEEVFFSVQMPHTWKAGSTIYPHVHWAPSTAGSGGISWKLEYTWQSIGSVFGNTSTVEMSDTTNSTSHEHLITNMTNTISGSGQTESSMLICRLYRDVSDTDDTYAADAFLLEFDIHYEIEKLGSDEVIP